MNRGENASPYYFSNNGRINATSMTILYGFLVTDSTLDRKPELRAIGSFIYFIRDFVFSNILSHKGE